MLLTLHPGLRARRKTASRALASRLWLQDGREWLDGGRDAFVARLRELTAEEPRRLSRGELRRHFTMVVDLQKIGSKIHFRDALGHFLSIGDFALRASAWTDVAPHEVVDVLAGSSPFSIAPLDHLDRIVDALNKDRDVRRWFLDDEVPAEERLTKLRSASPEAATALDEYLLEHGHRAVSGFDLDDKSIAEMPDVLVASIAARLNPPAITQPATADWLRPRVPDQHRAEYDATQGRGRSPLWGEG